MKRPDKQALINAAIRALEKEPNGLRTGVLTQERLRPMLGDGSLSHLHNVLLEYAREAGAKIYQPQRGWFRHARFRDSDEGTDATQTPDEQVAESIVESTFYVPFAEWLVEEDECTKAIAVGGVMMKDKFGTPDVVGILRPRLGDVFQPPIEIVSAEIKVATNALITAFGQACAYKLFSHRCYIVIPRRTDAADKDRLESLCFIFQIGLVVFDATAPKNPQFERVARAGRTDPDSFYVNEKIKLLKEILK